MPSRLGVGLVLAFWLATTGYVGYREVWPRLFSDAPPPVQIDLADEAARELPTSWDVYRGDHKSGRLTTVMRYVPEDDTFRFVSSYANLSFESGPLALEVPNLLTTVRVSRSGALREQQMAGTLKGSLKAGPARLSLGDAKADVTGTVEGGQLVGRCTVWYPADAKTPSIDRPLDPVPVPEGQVLNPMMPVGRLRDVRPGRRWVIRQVDPLQDALAAVAQEWLRDNEAARKSELLSGLFARRQRGRELLAEVRSAPERLDRPKGEPVECWVIEYRGDEVEARTWVAISDGRVLRQEAAGFGERLRFERQE